MITSWRSYVTATFLAILTHSAATGQDWPSLYDPLTVPTFNITMSDADWETVKADTTFDIEVPAKFFADGEDPIVVSVRRKSATALGDKVSLKIDINEYEDSPSLLQGFRHGSGSSWSPQDL